MGILLVRMKTNDKKIFGRWFEVMTAGTADKVALYWYAEPSILTTEAGVVISGGGPQWARYGV